MRNVLLGCAAAALLVAPGAQAQDETAVFKPTGGWTADYGDDYCRLIRTFSNGEDELSLAMERLQPGDQVRLILVGNGLSPFRGADQIGYRFLPSGSSLEARYVRSETEDGNQFLKFDPVTLSPGAAAPPAPGTPPPPYSRDAEQDAARGIAGVALGKGLTAPVRIETGSLRAPVAAMQVCADDLLKVWGLDPDKHKAMTAAVVPNFSPNGWLPQGMIPFGEFEKFGGGSNQVRMIVGADGKPASCAIYAPTLSQSLNDRICSVLMEKASFQPAKDAEGKAMASVWMGSPMLLGPPFPGGR